MLPKKKLLLLLLYYLRLKVNANFNVQENLII